jgi:hypothetical protein
MELRRISSLITLRKLKSDSRAKFKFATLEQLAGSVIDVISDVSEAGARTEAIGISLHSHERDPRTAIVQILPTA